MKRSHSEAFTNVLSTEAKKIVLLGDGCIGKSTFFDKMNNLNNEDYRFPKKYRATDNFDFNRLAINTNKGIVTIDMWDTAGQENRGGKLRDAYLKGADAVLLLYDVTERKTKDNLNKWIKQIKEVSPNIPVAVCGNKSDKFKNLQQSESVKLRECNLQSQYGYSKIRNFLISIKEDTHIEFAESWWNGTNIAENEGCMVGLEYLLGELFNTKLTVKY